MSLATRKLGKLANPATSESITAISPEPIAHQEFVSPETLSSESLRVSLIEAQYALRDTRDKPRGRGVLILMSGIELAGKGDALKQLRGWADPRLLKARARLPVEPNSPMWLQDAALLPEKGEIVILFGSWYGDLLKSRMAYLQQNKKHSKKQDTKKDKNANSEDVALNMTSERFHRELQQLQAFEQDLRNQGITICKCWFDLSWETLQEHLDDVKKTEGKWLSLHGLDWRKKAQYDALTSLRQEIGIDWIDINCEDPKQRDLDFGHIVLSALRQPRLPSLTAARGWKQAVVPTVLLTPDQSVLEKETYKARLKDAQTQFAKLVHQCGSRSIVVVFEGMDAAGKGGAISRIVEPLDPRQYEVFPIAAPESHELRHPYLWRFWSKLSAQDTSSTNLAIFDRSWYGRVLVERIEGLARAGEWQSGYAEINRFEQDLTSSGRIVIKFWLSVSRAEQAQRFAERQAAPHKRFKITSDDWRNRQRWDDYLQAAADMFARTNTAEAPWIIVATDDKYTARLAVLESLNQRLESVLGVT